MAASTQASAQLDNIPPELTVGILSNLTAKDIARFRRVSKHMLNFVDYHLNAVLKTLESRKIEDLRGFIKYTLDFGEEIPFHHALGRVIKHRGIWPQYVDCAPSIMLFSALWIHHQQRRYPHPIGGMNPLPGYVCMLAGTLLDLHVQRHTSDFQSFSKSMPDLPAFLRRAMLQDSYSDSATKHYRIDEAYATRMYHDICDPEKHVLDGPLHGQPINKAGSADRARRIGNRCNPQSHTPQWPLTRLQITEADSPDQRERCRGICRQTTLGAMLGVPLLPAVWSGQYDLAYCVESGWAYNVVKGAWATGKAPTGLLRAAVLEEMYIY